MKVYISGKITGNDSYMKEFEQTQRKLEAMGYSVLNSAATCATLPEDTDYEDYMRIAFDLLDMADSVYFLRTWQDSKGANREYGYALAKGKKIVFEV